MLSQSVAVADPKIPEIGPDRMQVLIIDDNEVDRKRIARLCKKSGIVADMAEVANLTEFREILSQRVFDIVFIDYLIASESGLDAIDILQAHPDQAAAAAIMVAGEGEIQVAVEAMRKGSADYVLKSGLSVDSMQKSIATAIERQTMKAALEEERSRRLTLEASIRRFAHSSTAEMRTVLAAALRRVRELKSYTPGGTYASDLHSLEQCIDAMWEKLPQISTGLLNNLGDTKLRALN